MSDLASDSYNKRQERLRTLEDMSLELWDVNFNVQVSSEVLSRDDKYIKVTMQKKSEPSPLGMYGAPRFDYNKIKDTLLSMYNVMNEYLLYYHTNFKEAQKNYTTFTDNSSNINFAWTQYLGHYYFTQFELDIGGQIIDRLYGEWLFLWSRLSKPFDARGN